MAFHTNGGTMKIAQRVNHGEEMQEPVVSGEEELELALGGEETSLSEHGAQVGDEAGGQNQLADVVTFEAGLPMTA
jgi:hypothetical protein